MEKQDSLATVTVKEFPDNESYTTEAPPAYRQPRSTAVQVARIVAVTVVAASTILGACLLASAWIQARATCELMMMEHQLQEAEYRAAEHERPSFQALVQDQEGSSTTTEAVTTADPGSQESSQDSSQEDSSQENDVHRIKLPLQLDFDDLAGSLMERNQRAHMNCVVEKRRSEELVDHAPRSVQLPFGLNLTTAPRLEHLTGERMVISCESGNRRQLPVPMPHPVIVPLPGPMHMPISFHGVPQHHPMMHNDVEDQQQQHPMDHMEVIVAHHVSPPVPLSAMVPPPQQAQEHDGAESRAYQGFPMHMPVQMREMRAMTEEMPQQMRPHYVQPRSVPSDPTDFLKKRVKRCACNCDC